MMLALLTAICVCLAIHLGGMAWAAHLLGIRIRHVQYGVGPTLFSFGWLRVKGLPISGHVKLKDSREECLAPDDLDDAFDHQPVWKQVLVPFAGCCGLVLVSLLGLGMEGWSSFVRGFAQIFEGALSPLGAGQAYLHAFSDFASTNSLISVWALVASKMAAINLLPFGAFNGGHIVMALLRRGRPELRGEKTMAVWGICLSLVLVLAWLVALGAYSGIYAG
jgi:membrane-associated protease RseP (regulator of RpoE activity)